MDIKKIFSVSLDHCYAAGCTWVGGKPKLLLATEEHGPALCVDGETLEMTRVCDGPGGVMSLVPVPGRDGDFLATHGFYPVFQSKAAGITWYSPKQNGWVASEILKLPYVHRFDLFQAEDGIWFLGATLCTSKTETEDWSDPGKLWAGRLPDGPDGQISVQPIFENLVKNHGYCHAVWNGQQAGLVASESGVHLVKPPKTRDGEWSIERLIDRPISDVAICDMDGDGEPELLLLEGFHGNAITINKKIDGKYQVVWEPEKAVEFVHVAWGGLLRGVPTFICGSRRLEASLFYVRYNKVKGVYEQTEIEKMTGPSNVAVVPGKQRDLIVAANHGIGEGAVYAVTD